MNDIRRANLKRLLAPRHIAFIGGKARESGIRDCARGGFEGPVWVVNPKYRTLGGQPCFASIADLPEPPDAVYVGVSREATLEAVRELAAAGAGGAVCYAAGFAETGDEGAALQDELAAAAGDLALVGPNCYGVLNHADGIALWPVAHPARRVERGAAFIAQSGNICLNLTYNQRSVPFAYVISAGNQAVLEVGHYIEALLDDDRVTVIGVYLEAIGDVAQFSRAAASALDKGVPIVALKAGRTQASRQIAVSHTGSLAGSDEAYVALFDRLGIIRAETPAKMLEILKVLSVTGPLPGPRLAVLTCSGGESALIADYAEDYGVELPQPSDAQQAEMRALLPHFAAATNPLDYTPVLWGQRAPLEALFTAVMRDGYDGALLIVDYLRGLGVYPLVDNAIDALIAASKATGVAAMHGCELDESVTENARERMIAAGVAPLQGLENAVAAAGAAATYGVRRAEILDDAADLAVATPGAEPHDARTLDEHAGKQRLAEFGLPIPDGRLVDAATAADAAREIGFPVALKVVSEAIAHKSDIGGLRLGLADAGAVAAAAAEMTAALGSDRFLVEAMVGDAVCELMIGVTRDPQLGLLLVVGAGGVLVEVIRDTRSLLLPTARAQVERAVEKLATYKLLTGYRGRPAGDVGAVIDAVLAVARFAEAHRERLVELDVNPLMVRPAGHGAVAADALVRIAQ